MALLSPAQAQHAMEPANHPPPHAESSVSQAELPYSGVVRGIDRKHRKIKLQHGPITDLGMSAMTMAMTMEYLAADSEVLEGLKRGDKVRFGAQRAHGAFVLTGIEKLS